MKTCSLATIGITMGDAAGVGPEIIMKSLDHADLYERCHPLVIGDATRDICDSALSLRVGVERLHLRLSNGQRGCLKRQQRGNGDIRGNPGHGIVLHKIGLQSP